MRINEFTIVEVSTGKGSAFVKSFNVDMNGVPFARIAKFSANQGGNWYVGFANKVGIAPRFATYEAAEEYARGQA